MGTHLVAYVKAQENKACYVFCIYATLFANHIEKKEQLQ